MRRPPARRHGTLLAALLLGGCAGGARLAEERTDSGAEAEPTQDAVGDRARPGREPEDSQDPPLAPADPWGRVAGGPAGEAPPAPAVIGFQPPQDPRPVALERRPALGPGQVLAVVLVREGNLAPEGDLILRLDAELSREEELDAVVGPGSDPDPPQVDLAGLASLAARNHRHLLLVDVVPSRRPDGLRDGYLVHAPSGALLACWTVEPGNQGQPVAPTGQAADLVQRIAAAHARLGGDG